MLTKETLSVLRRTTIVRGLSLPIAYLSGTNRMSRYRVQIPPDAQDLLVGQTLADSYYVLSVLGFGGMSVVYKAKRLNKPRIFAVKTLRLQSLSDERTVKRFQREAELLSHLNHPRIVQVAFYGTTPRGQPYFVMDYLTGENLTSVFKNEGPLSAARVRDIFSQVCGAVDHAHRCGVVHRDLKPGNIMLMEQDGQKDFVKVVDFGIARFEEEAQRLTRMGEVWGSPVYMSPEQCMGAQLDVRSDIYSLGVVMFEALTGRVPHLGKTYVETMSMQIMNYPKPFSEVAPGRTFPAGLEKLVRKALEKEPDKRYQTMGELRADLEQVVPRSGKESQTVRGTESRGTGNRLPGLPQTVAKLFDQAINPGVNKKTKVVKGPPSGPPSRGRATGPDYDLDDEQDAFGKLNSAKSSRLPDPSLDQGSSSPRNPRVSASNNPVFGGRISSANNTTYSGRNSSSRNQSFRDSQSRIKHLQSQAANSSQSISLVIMLFAFAAMTVALIALATQLLGGLRGNGQLKILSPEQSQSAPGQPQPNLLRDLAPPQNETPSDGQADNTEAAPDRSLSGPTNEINSSSGTSGLPGRANPSDSIDPTDVTRPSATTMPGQTAATKMPTGTSKRVAP
jgi:eukaryotic-like serine/threonine-protein kinase